jgi:predicted small metal-binding protein
MKVLCCRELGFDCAHEVRAASEEEIVRQAAEHTRSRHDVEVTPEIAAQARALICKEETIHDLQSSSSQWSERRKCLPGVVLTRLRDSPHHIARASSMCSSVVLAGGPRPTPP